MPLHAVQTSYATAGCPDHGFRKVPDTRVSGLTAKDHARLQALRLAARRTRVSPHRSLEQTSLTAQDRTTPFASLTRCLPLALGHTPVIYRADEDSLSFDEAWVLRLLDRVDATDWESLHFLIARRVPRRARVAMRVLLGACQDV